MTFQTDVKNLKVAVLHFCLSLCLCLTAEKNAYIKSFKEIYQNSFRTFKTKRKFSVKVLKNQIINLWH